MGEVCNVAMYLTNRECRPAGRLHGRLVVSMRPIPADQVDTAIRVSGRMSAVHGAPAHTGTPAALVSGDWWAGWWVCHRRPTPADVGTS